MRGTILQHLVLPCPAPPQRPGECLDMISPGSDKPKIKTKMRMEKKREGGKERERRFASSLFAEVKSRKERRLVKSVPRQASHLDTYSPPITLHPCQNYAEVIKMRII